MFHRDQNQYHGRYDGDYVLSLLQVVNYVISSFLRFKLFNNRHQMMNFTNHTTNGRGILMLYYTIELFQTESI